MKIAREKESIITIMVGFIVLYSILSLHWLWMIALGVGIAGITSDKLTHWIHLVWFLLGKILGYIMSRLILGILFLIVLLPIALLAKIFRRDFMMLKNNYPSYFVERHHVYQPKNLENPW